MVLNLKTRANKWQIWYFCLSCREKNYFDFEDGVKLKKKSKPQKKTSRFRKLLAIAQICSPLLEYLLLYGAVSASMMSAWSFNSYFDWANVTYRLEFVVSYFVAVVCLRYFLFCSVKHVPNFNWKGGKP